MKNLNYIAKDLFAKIRGRFPSVTIGDEQGKVTNVPEDARYFDFDYKESEDILGKVSISLDEDSLSVMYSNDFVANEDQITRNNWYNFLKELRQFSKKRMLNFDTRNITKSNLNKRDYQYLATNRNTGDENMTESKMYGNNKNSFQKIGNAKLSIKHTEEINTENAAARSQKIGKIFIESPEGERFRYPYKHLSGARAMARHVAEGGNPYDDFGKHIVGLSEELAKLKKFNTYMNRSSVMAESLSGYSEVVKERVLEIKKSIQNLQKESFYKEALESFEAPTLEEVPDDVKENWIDQLTIKQFNEELADVFPYIYKLVSEATKAKEITAEDLLGEKRDTHCSDKCCGSDVKAEDCTCPPDCEHCNCNATNVNESSSCNCGDDCACGGNCTPDCNCGPDCGTVTEGPIDWMKDKFNKAKDNFKQGQKERMAKYEGQLKMMRKIMKDNGMDDYSIMRVEQGCLNDPRVCMYNHIRKNGFGHKNHNELQDVYQELKKGWTTRSGTTDEQIESAFEELMGQFGEKLTPTDDEWSKKLQIPNRETWEKLIKQAKAKGDKKMLGKLMAMGQFTDEGNAYGHAIQQAKMQGKKKGDKIDGPDGKEITLGEFILSYFDRETGKFPKGETAVLTMVEKDYGEQFINPAKQFIDKINSRVAEMGYNVEESGLQRHIGIKKYGKKGFEELQKAGREGASEEEKGAIKDKYISRESDDIMRLAGL